MKAIHIAKIAKSNPGAAIAALKKRPFSSSVSVAKRLGVNVSFKENKREFWEEVTENLSLMQGKKCLKN